MTSDSTIVCAWVVVKVPVSLTKFSQNRMSESIWKRRVARKKKKKKKKKEMKELDIAAVTDGVPCRLWDFDPWLTPGCQLIPQMW